MIIIFSNDVQIYNSVTGIYFERGGCQAFSGEQQFGMSGKGKSIVLNIFVGQNTGP